LIKTSEASIASAMKSFTVWLIALLTVSTYSSARAATPKNGRYKGTFTVQATLFNPNSDGESAVVKKVIVVQGMLNGTDLQLVLAEKPLLPGFDDVVCKGTLAADSLTLSWGNSAILNGVRFTASSIKGSADLSFGASSDTPYTGSGVTSYPTIFLMLSRVGK
jgi:hypothetical protein